MACCPQRDAIDQVLHDHASRCTAASCGHTFPEVRDGFAPSALNTEPLYLLGVSNPMGGSPLPLFVAVFSRQRPERCKPRRDFHPYSAAVILREGTDGKDRVQLLELTAEDEGERVFFPTGWMADYTPLVTA